MNLSRAEIFRLLAIAAATTVAIGTVVYVNVDAPERVPSAASAALRSYVDCLQPAVNSATGTAEMMAAKALIECQQRHDDYLQSLRESGTSENMIAVVDTGLQNIPLTMAKERLKAVLKQQDAAARR
jgi:hypothetical protein